MSIPLSKDGLSPVVAQSGGVGIPVQRVKDRSTGSIGSAQEDCDPMSSGREQSAQI
ncbi:hypothetical protein AB0880_01610 [Micromonospora chersina]|uniref:hypothetical protein n=1 Tax=Micromonospora chersina TaxID=47854 RepID=UPI0034522B88